MDSMLAPGLCLQSGHDKAVHIVDREGQNPSAYGIQYHYLTERDWSEDDSYDRSLLCVMKFLEYARRLMSWIFGSVHFVHSVVVAETCSAASAQDQCAGQVSGGHSIGWELKCYKTVDSLRSGCGMTCSLSWVSIFRGCLRHQHATQIHPNQLSNMKRGIIIV